MKFKNLEEAVTSQGFTFGFELECVMPLNLDVESLNLPINFKMTTDTSIKLNGADANEYMGRELVSEPLTLSPQSIVNVKKSIIELHKNKVSTNPSCGFHVHYSYSTMTFADICWLLANLSVNSDATELFSEFEGIDFFSEEYADIEFLNDIKEHLAMGMSPNKVFTTEKYRIIRIHPQGTLEWRGPRDFMNNSDMNLIDKFFIRLYKNADKISKLISNTQLTFGEINISKNDFYKDLNSSNSSIKKSLKAASQNKRDIRFSADQDQSILGNIFKMKPELSKCLIKNITATIEDNRIKISSGSFSGKISGVDFFMTLIQNATLSDCTISEKSISGSKLDKCKIISANSIRNDYTKCKLLNVSAHMSNLDSCDIYKGSFDGCEISNSKFLDKDMYISDSCKITNCQDPQ